jgi:hypothetical protein
MDNLTIFKGYHEKYKGTLVLDHFKVCLFRGMIFDEEDDYYYDLLEYAKKKSYWMSGVGRIIFLKDVFSKEEYEYLRDTWNYNNDEKAE